MNLSDLIIKYETRCNLYQKNIKECLDNGNKKGIRDFNRLLTECEFFLMDLYRLKKVGS